MFPFIDFLVFSNIWISLAASLIFYAVFSKFSIEFLGVIVFSQIFGGTLFAYSFLRYKSINHISFKYSPIALWMKNNLIIVRLFMSLGILLFFAPFLILDLSLNYLAVWFVIIFLGLIYLPLRNFWFFKTLIVSIVWTLISVVLPFALLNLIDIKSTLFLFFSFLFFYIAITLPFEIRDLKYDKADKKLVTFSLKFGVRNTKLASIIFALLSLVLFFLSDFNIGLVFTIIFMLISMLLYKTKEESSEYIFTFLFDGLIILFAILLKLRAI